MAYRHMTKTSRDNTKITPLTIMNRSQTFVFLELEQNAVACRPTPALVACRCLHSPRPCRSVFRRLRIALSAAASPRATTSPSTSSLRPPPPPLSRRSSSRTPPALAAAKQPLLTKPLLSLAHPSSRHSVPSGLALPLPAPIRMHPLFCRARLRWR